MAHYFASRRWLRFRAPLVSALLALLTACNPSTPVKQAPDAAVIDDALAAPALEEVERFRRALAADVRTAAAALDAAATRFLARPEAETLRTLRTAWTNLHSRYGAMRLFPLSVSERSADQWPIEPGFIDALPGYPESGLINDLTIDMSAESLRSQHGFTDQTEASLGFHPIEFLVFQREPEDYDGDSVTIQRRRDALQLMTAELQMMLEASTEAPDLEGSVHRQIAAVMRSQQEAIEQAVLHTRETGVHRGFSEADPDSLQAMMTALDQLYAPEKALYALTSAIAPSQAAQLREMIEAPPADGAFTLPLQLEAIGHQLSSLRQTYGASHGFTD